MNVYDFLGLNKSGKNDKQEVLLDTRFLADEGSAMEYFINEIYLAERRFLFCEDEENRDIEMKAFPNQRLVGFEEVLQKFKPYKFNVLEINGAFSKYTRYSTAFIYYEPLIEILSNHKGEIFFEERRVCDIIKRAVNKTVIKTVEGRHWAYVPGEYTHKNVKAFHDKLGNEPFEVLACDMRISEELLPEPFNFSEKLKIKSKQLLRPVTKLFGK